MKESNSEDAEIEHLLERFRIRLEQKTRSLLDVGMPLDAVEKIILRHMRIEEGSNDLSESEVANFMRVGHLRQGEARRAVIINQELLKMLAKKIPLTKALKTLLERLGNISSSFVQELQWSKGLEKEDLPQTSFDSSKKEAGESFSKSPDAQNKLTTLASSNRKRNIGVLRNSNTDFKTTSSLKKITLLCRKRQKSSQGTNKKP